MSNKEIHSRYWTYEFSHNTYNTNSIIKTYVMTCNLHNYALSLKTRISATTILTNCASRNFQSLTHWGRVMHICVSKLTIIGSDNGLAPGRRQTIFWTNDGILFIGPLGTNFNEILIGIKIFSFKKMHLKMSSAKWCPFCLGLNVLIDHPYQGNRYMIHFPQTNRA